MESPGNVLIPVYQGRQKGLVTSFYKEVDFYEFRNISRLMVVLKVNYEPDDWRLFIDFSTSLEAALLHNGSVLLQLKLVMRLIWKNFVTVLTSF